MNELEDPKLTEFYEEKSGKIFSENDELFIEDKGGNIEVISDVVKDENG